MYATTEIAMTNDLREITEVASQIDSFCKTHKLSSEIAYSVNLSLEELLANTISYGYEDDGTHRIEILVRLENQTLIIIIIDDGIAFDPTQAPAQEQFMSLEEPELGGLGLLLINRMMNGLEYQRRANCNIVILTKNTEATSSEEGNS